MLTALPDRRRLRKGGFDVSGGFEKPGDSPAAAAGSILPGGAGPRNFLSRPAALC
ncbi:hypothetical protein [Blastochloris viridis]|uniref:hypothetical protein n=1 Tax=Blastochloris viridis TaxID=1079 RepID=UPI001AEC860C|nr:hypothetical protein [Blastochloris viridis]